MNATTEAALSSVLLADGPSDEIPSEHRIYDFLIGSWLLTAIDHPEGAAIRQSNGECHAAWVLEGRAVQDVWICPAITERTPGMPRLGNRFGTTLRVYDPLLQAWHVTWINPVTRAKNTLIGRREGNQVVQEGRDDRGNLIRWRFNDITAPVLHWTGEVSPDAGQTWHLQTEFLLRRRVG